MNKQSPKITIKFEPSLAFQDEFAEFVSKILSWPKQEKSTNQPKTNGESENKTN